MKLLVPLRMAWIDSIWLAVSDSLDGGDDGDAAGHGRLEGDRAAQLPRRVEQLGPVLGQQGLVGGDHVLAAFQQLQHDGPGRLQPADQLDRRDDLRVVGHFGQIGGQHARRQGEVPRPLQVGIDHVDQFQPLAGLSGDPVAVFQQQPGDAGADRSEPDNGNFDGVHIRPPHSFFTKLANRPCRSLRYGRCMAAPPARQR